MPIYKKVNKDFFKKWSPKMAYVLGFFAADGYMTLNKRGAYFWSIQIKDKDLLESIRESIQSNHKIGVKFKSGKVSYRLQIGSREMYTDLQKLGMCQNKTKSLTVPNIPNRYLTHFTRGYFDGDGNVWVGLVHKKRNTPTLVINTVFTSCSGNFLDDLRRRLEKNGVDKGVLRKGRGNYYRLVYSVRSSLKIYDFMYNTRTKQSLFLLRKKRMFEKYIMRS